MHRKWVQRDCRSDLAVKHTSIGISGYRSARSGSYAAVGFETTTLAVLRSLDRGIHRCMTPPPPVRVLFLFPDSSELRHMRDAPRLGSRIRSPQGAAWTVADVVKSGKTTFTVTCVARSDYGASVRGLAGDLLEAVRHSISRSRLPVSESPRRSWWSEAHEASADFAEGEQPDCPRHSRHPRP